MILFHWCNENICSTRFNIKMPKLKIEWKFILNYMKHFIKMQSVFIINCMHMTLTIFPMLKMCAWNRIHCICIVNIFWVQNISIHNIFNSFNLINGLWLERLIFCLQCTMRSLCSLFFAAFCMYLIIIQSSPSLYLYPSLSVQY